MNYAFLFSRLSGHEGTIGKIGVARIECSNTRRQKHCEQGEDDGKRPLPAFHGSTPLLPSAVLRRICRHNGRSYFNRTTEKPSPFQTCRMIPGPWSPHALPAAPLAALCVLLATACPCKAQYPERPIRLILPFPAGGAVDHVARLVTARMAEELGRPFVIENKSGAGGIIATDATAKAAADGYTLLLTTPNHTINAALSSKLPYDTEKDLAPVSIVAEVPELLVSPSGGAVCRLCRLCRLCQEQSRQAQLLFRWQWHAAACNDGIAAATHRHHCRPYSLPRRGAGDDRPARRTGAAQDGYLCNRPPACRAGQVAGARLREPRALGIDAGCSDDRGNGPNRLRGHIVDRHHGSGGDAEVGDREARRGWSTRGSQP